MKERKEKLIKLLKAVGFKSIHDFAVKTKSPYTGKNRSSAGIKIHLEKSPQDIRVLKGYARDLQITFMQVLELFDIEINFNEVEK